MGSKVVTRHLFVGEHGEGSALRHISAEGSTKQAAAKRMLAILREPECRLIPWLLSYFGYAGYEVVESQEPGRVHADSLRVYAKGRAS